ncbi:putative hydrolase of the HAD superfamily [Micromonospora pattaloongensis]|uniref:Putative hydrolase of the HAD superfamily n=1 Tax=Micromonospora pattaloongensis TaxID=405436 RepID=A0A1H3KS24_9ACTN|nr:HAD-IA family hydrolase [Micromonospora pattaloongensis]SDY54963.1 putative hydrolase of the HAD superfamily [Micromonospora pattaloongensis]
MQRERPTALLIDFDGVLRHWDPELTAGVERRHGLPEGSLLRTALEWSRAQPALTGQISHAEWMAEVTRALAEQTGDPERARVAVEEWERDRGAVDPDVLGFIRELRAGGVRVGLATNATDLLDADLAALNLVDELDVVINSSVVGVHKPAKDYFHEACRAVGALPKQVLFVDDDDRTVRGARAAGLSAHRWTGPHDLTYLRAAFTA